MFCGTRYLSHCRTEYKDPYLKLTSQFIQGTRAVAGIPRDAAVNFNTLCLETINRSAARTAYKCKKTYQLTITG